MFVAKQHRGSQAPLGAACLPAPRRGLDMPLLTELENYFSRPCGYKHAAPDGAIPFAQGCATPGQRLLASKAIFVAALPLWKRSGL
jgi:hypothetical protein